MFRKNLPGCNAFDHSNYFGNTVCGYALNEVMYMINIRADLKELDLIPLLDLQTDVLQRYIYLRVKHSTSVFRRKHKMIE